MTQGLSLLPGEEKLFAEFPDTILPYLAIRQPRQGKSRIKTVSYQMVGEPCPLYDPAKNACKRYEKRPAVCRAYPFSADGVSVESTCEWEKSETIEYGETAVIKGAEQEKAASELKSFYIGLNQRMCRTGYTKLLMFDVNRHTWVQIEMDEAD
jgi:Fe-S-cluster containining protein